MAMPTPSSGHSAASVPRSISRRSRSIVGGKPKRSKREEAKQATIRQHYYPEGGWGHIIVLVTFLVQSITHGLQMALGIVLLVMLRRWGEDTMEASGAYIKLLVHF